MAKVTKKQLNAVYFCAKKNYNLYNSVLFFEKIILCYLNTKFNDSNIAIQIF